MADLDDLLSQLERESGAAGPSTAPAPVSATITVTETSSAPASESSKSSSSSSKRYYYCGRLNSPVPLLYAGVFNHISSLALGWMFDLHFAFSCLLNPVSLLLSDAVLILYVFNIYP